MKIRRKLLIYGLIFLCVLVLVNPESIKLFKHSVFFDELAMLLTLFIFAGLPLLGVATFLILIIILIKKFSKKSDNNQKVNE